MSWLARLKRQTALDQDATKPTQPPEADHEAGFVGFVACPPVPIQKIKALKAAANDAAAETLAADTDRYCWPHSDAMNGQEIDTFTARLAQFTDKGLSLDDAERSADKLVIRDRESDDRRLCLECAHLQGRGRWRCGNWGVADVARDGLAPDLVKILQRCSGYPPATNNAA
ncbi:hypothetical protein F3K02_08450 [Hydrogenophaga sp. D2P1]|uniref:Uncharacterized protein n=1 Tax=Hydrogenophaga aromaticivorans TaxID=2610898 RepID=A0A7Y8GVK4_9BURK|nr:hypothetical protein [Hydrogenophaga aromaticivorans]NWF45281.1 hypothetical protein [Hydrogenophaga aromaticivorans]